MSESKSAYFEIDLVDGNTKNLLIGNTGNIDLSDERNTLMVEIWIQEQVGRLLKDKYYFPDNILTVRRVTRAKWIKNSEEHLYISGIHIKN